MAVATVDPIFRDMMFVTKGNGLLERDVDGGRVGRPVNFPSDPTERTNKRDSAEGDHARMNVRAR